MTFDLKSGGNCCFKTGKDHYIYTVDTMTRTVCFPLVEEPQTTTCKRKREPFRVPNDEDLFEGLAPHEFEVDEEDPPMAGEEDEEDSDGS